MSYAFFTVYVLRSSLFSLLGFFNDAGCMAALEAEHYLQEIGSQEGKTDWWVPVKVQPNGWKLGMSCRSRHPSFIATRRVSLDYLMHDFGKWDHVSLKKIVQKREKKKKKLIDEQYLIKGKELSPKQWHFTMSLLDALINSYIMLHLFSAVNFSWLIGFDKS